MNTSAIRLSISAAELAVCKPESVKNLDNSVRAVLSEIDQAKAQKQAAQDVTPENLAARGVGPAGIVTIMKLSAAGIMPGDPRASKMVALAALMDAFGVPAPESCALATEDESETDGEVFQF